MAKKNRKGIVYPKGFMHVMKKIKRKKIRQRPINDSLVEQFYNTAERVI